MCEKKYAISKTGKDAGLLSQDFKETATKGYYVDKSLLIKDFMDSHADVTLITRPRRFGKSLNMDMFKTFFEKTAEDTSVYFADLKISQCGEKYMGEQGKYPVICLDFKNVEGDSWEEMLSDIKKTIAIEYKRREEELDGFMSQSNAKVFNRVKDEIGTDSDYKDSLRFLTELICKRYGQKPIVLIDEYDAPILRAVEHDCYSKAIGFFRGLYSAALKGNKSNFEFALLFGVTRIAGEGLFSGFNNADIYSTLDERYSEYFGFCEAEVQKILADYDATDRYHEVCEWYDGYVFGKIEMFNPVSIMNYIKNGFKARAYWVNSSEDIELKYTIKKLTDGLLKNLFTLSEGGVVSVRVKERITYQNMSEADNIYSILLMTGYLKLFVPHGKHYEEELDAATDKLRNGEEVSLKLVNKEVEVAFANDVLDYAENICLIDDAAEALKKAVLERDVGSIEKEIRDYVYNSVSYYDTVEGFHHGLILGFFWCMSRAYAVTSNRESGDGRFDIMIEPKRGIDALPGIVLELKVCDKEDDLPAKAEEALNQINRNDYARDMVTRGVKDVLKIGMAFYGKKVEFAS